MSKQYSGSAAPIPAPASTPKDPIKHLNQIDLSRRWRISPRTLERWRWLKQGPVYLKVGGHVVYRIKDIEAYEASQLRGHAAGSSILGTWR